MNVIAWAYKWGHLMIFHSWCCICRGTFDCNCMSIENSVNHFSSQHDYLISTWYPSILNGFYFFQKYKIVIRSSKAVRSIWLLTQQQIHGFGVTVSLHETNLLLISVHYHIFTSFVVV